MLSLSLETVQICVFISFKIFCLILPKIWLHLLSKLGLSLYMRVRLFWQKSCWLIRVRYILLDMPLWCVFIIEGAKYSRFREIKRGSCFSNVSGQPEKGENTYLYAKNVCNPCPHLNLAFIAEKRHLLREKQKTHNRLVISCDKIVRSFSYSFVFWLSMVEPLPTEKNARPLALEINVQKLCTIKGNFADFKPGGEPPLKKSKQLILPSCLQFVHLQTATQWNKQLNKLFTCALTPKYSTEL